MDPHHAEQAELGAAGKPCLPRHKCRTCERTRSIKVRVLTWIVGKISLILVIIVTSGVSTFLYHRILPDDVRHLPGSSSTSSLLSASASLSSTPGQGDGKDVLKPNGSVQGSMPSDLTLVPPSSTLTVATATRLGLYPQSQQVHLQMKKDDPQFFTSGDVKLDSDSLLVLRSTTLFISADVILKAMSSSDSERGPSTVVVCLSLVRGESSIQKPVTCHLTYLRQRDQQVARVWILLPVLKNDRIYVNCSWPSYVLTEHDDKLQSVFTAFEVGHTTT